MNNGDGAIYHLILELSTWQC